MLRLIENRAEKQKTNRKSEAGPTKQMGLTKNKPHPDDITTAECAPSEERETLLHVHHLISPQRDE